MEEQPQKWMDEKLFNLFTAKDVESECESKVDANETLFSSQVGLGLVRSLLFFLRFGVVRPRRFHFLFPASELSLCTRNLRLTSPAFFCFSPPFSSP